MRWDGDEMVNISSANQLKSTWCVPLRVDELCGMDVREMYEMYTVHGRVSLLSSARRERASTYSGTVVRTRAVPEATTVGPGEILPLGLSAEAEHQIKGEGRCFLEGKSESQVVQLACLLASVRRRRSWAWVLSFLGNVEGAMPAMVMSLKRGSWRAGCSDSVGEAACWPCCWSTASK